ncbi:MAG: DNA mismatch repair protein MutS [Spirochaetota bacterium]|nr:MAG: DNA mismatch repair protein MutS [Spirochaetota bacterium]
MKKETPMMVQYHRIKRNNKDAILLFRLGDFYEMFEKDAATASSILNIALTARNGVPMCGFPHHAADAYIAKLLKDGQKVAICEQQEDPKVAKGVVKRDVVEIISPGIISDPNLLEGKNNNCIAAITALEKRGEIRLACASLDISTGQFVSNYFPSGDIFDNILNEITDNGIREIIYPSSYEEFEFLQKLKTLASRVVFRGVDEFQFDETHCIEELKEQFSVVTTDIFGLQDSLEIIACGAVLSYVKDTSKRDISHIRWVKAKRDKDILFIDNATKRHLELTANQTDGSETATLLAVLDRTETAGGTRLLKKIINNPSSNIAEINNRLLKVQLFFNNSSLIGELRPSLSRILDLERILSKLSLGKGTARDLVALASSLSSSGKIKDKLERIDLFSEEKDALGDFSQIIHTIESGIVNDPPLSIKEGGFIKPGFSEKLDEYKVVTKENREWIARYQSEQQRKLGISSLKVKYNKIIGYYIEVTKPNLKLVPKDYIKKQTLVNAERFTTHELQEREIRLMEAREEANRLELSLFEKIKDSVLDYTQKIFKASEAIAKIDVFQSLAIVAMENNYSMPEIVEENIIDIKGSRHPVIEQFGEERFIENDLYLNDTDRRVMILTGPNMAGKSTYLRQAALIIIMAHIGSFVPAKEARLGIVDRLFSRIGASDRLVKGESTFLVEMIETSRILHYASSRSFIIMDEIGRGTSTYDGLSIAWAVLEYLLNENMVGAKVLFATHYHEITAIDKSDGVVNYNVTVKEWNNSVIFLRKVIPGIASKSYGIEVARMAGIPDKIIERAKSILSKLETEYSSYIPTLSNAGINETRNREEESNEYNPQLGLFPSAHEVLLNELGKINIDDITPIEALNILERLKRGLTT